MEKVMPKKKRLKADGNILFEPCHWAMVVIGGS